MPSTTDTKEVIVSKLGYIQKYLTQLEPLLEDSEEEISKNTERLRAVERLIQLIVDAAVDINTAIIQYENLQASEDYEGTFSIIEKTGAISSELAKDISPSVGLRNRLVHDYEKLEPIKMVHAVKNNIDQYHSYVKSIFEYIEKLK